MIRRSFLAATLGLLLCACAGSPTPEAPEPAAALEPTALDPTGSYDIMVVAPGMEIAGIMTIEGSAAEGYTGYVDTEMGGAAMANIAVEGQTMFFEIPDAGALVEVVFDGSEFAGLMTGAMGDAEFQGVKRSGM